MFSDKLYGNVAGKAPATGGMLGPGSSFSTSYPLSSTYSSAPVLASSSAKAEGLRPVPPPVDQQSPYSYGYGGEKKKMLIQSRNPGEDFSVYSTAYPSSVTGGHSYNSYGKKGKLRMFF